ncbi:SCY1-like protein 2 [Pollicipes pollicipes]|uniref:SCY1-like protein 2 n=1 Tax=Pollicipes pollicipes TaxID=41117 RepID=UPI001884DEFC|nr:SCY1-like protein 2 [Pollicipes pollicipes]
MLAQEVLAAVLQPILNIISEISQEEYETIILPRFRCIFSWPKSIQASVTLLENLHVILEKTPKDEIQTDVMPIIYNALDTTTAQIQRACLMAIPNVAEYIDEESARSWCFPSQGNLREELLRLAAAADYTGIETPRSLFHRQIIRAAITPAVVGACNLEQQLNHRPLAVTVKLC